MAARLDYIGRGVGHAGLRTRRSLRTGLRDAQTAARLQVPAQVDAFMPRLFWGAMIAAAVLLVLFRVLTGEPL